MTEPNETTQAVEQEIDHETPKGPDPEDNLSVNERLFLKDRRKANAEAQAAKAELSKARAELDRLKKFEEEAKTKDMTESERAKADADAAKAEAAAAKAEAALARAEAQIARSGVLDKYSHVMTSDLLAAQSKDPSLSLAEWIDEYKKDHAELFGAARPEPTGAGGPPAPNTGKREAEIKKLREELAHLESPVMRFRDGSDLRRVAISRRLSELEG